MSPEGSLDIIPVARSLLLEQLDDGVIVLDPELRVVDLNSAAERLLGLQRGWTPGTPAARVWGLNSGSTSTRATPPPGLSCTRLL